MSMVLSEVQASITGVQPKVRLVYNRRHQCKYGGQRVLRSGEPGIWCHVCQKQLQPSSAVQGGGVVQEVRLLNASVVLGSPKKRSALRESVVEVALDREAWTSRTSL